MEECKTLDSYNRNKQFTKKDSPILLEGYWIWWCEVHNQPLAWCDKQRAVEEALSEAEAKVRKAIKYTEVDLHDPDCPPNKDPIGLFADTLRKRLRDG